MTSDQFLVDEGSGHKTKLWRREVRRFGRVDWVWCDAPPGAKYEIRFEDRDGHPVDCFDLPIFGYFIETSTKKILTSGSGEPT